jgi:hypothetical protein
MYKERIGINFRNPVAQFKDSKLSKKKPPDVQVRPAVFSSIILLAFNRLLKKASINGPAVFYYFIVLLVDSSDCHFQTYTF